jgi:multidrug resistance efflux pump
MLIAIIALGVLAALGYAWFVHHKAQVTADIANLKTKVATIEADVKAKIP